MASINDLLFFVLYDLAIDYAILVKKFKKGIFILIIAICANANLMFVGRLPRSFCDKAVQFITYFLYPFSDGKCDKEPSFPLYV